MNWNKLLSLPPVASEHGRHVDNLIIYMHWLMIALFVGWLGYFTFVLIRFRRARNPKADYLGVRSHASSYLEGAVALVEHRFAKADVALRADVASDLPVIHGDPRLLEHAVVNLLLNACDACASGGAVVVSARAGDGDRGLVVAVVDDGPGISQVDAGRVLEPFFSTKPSGQGTGIGLALVQEIVASHRGSLALESVAPHGTRATIKLPSSEESAHA